MKVEVKPLSNTLAWMGVEMKDSFKRPITVEAFVNINKGIYETGLTEEEIKDYSGKLGVDLSNKLVFADGKISPHPFYHSAQGRVKLENNTMIFNTEFPLDYVKLQMLRVCGFVAKSLIEQDATPDATHYIHSEEEDVEVAATKLALRNRCIAEFMKLNTKEKEFVVSILSDRHMTNKSVNFLDVEIESIIDKKPEDFLKYVKIDKNELAIRGILLEAIRRGVLTKEAGSVYYMGELFAEDFEAAVGKFNQPDNQKIKVGILERLKNA